MSAVDASGRGLTGLARRKNHWLLANRFIEVLSLDRGADGRARGGQVRMHGPLGTLRTASTEVVVADPPHEMVGTAEVARRTRARVWWRLMRSDDGTAVSLAATIETAGGLDRLLLLLGGRAWLARRFTDVVARLAQRFAAVQAEPGPRSRELEPT